ncbi:HIT family protein [Betaproteobacteria bacterium GR16-43]|nr:HIT family protein [Betaproteobacteria bacterium GR16-43]
MAPETCELCNNTGGTLLWQNDLCRVVAVEEPEYPGFLRVIASRHVREMTDLADGERRDLMDVVFAVESAVRETLQPDKMNLASLGNMTPHVHWHVIPRFRDDRHFPGPVWSEAKREGTPGAQRIERAALLQGAIAAKLGKR